MLVKTLRAACLAAIGLVAFSGAAAADPVFQTFVLTPLSASELSDLEHGAAPRITPSFIDINDVDIAESPVSAGQIDWREAPRSRGIAEMREQFETGDTPLFQITRFSTQ